ncbi:c-type cytochrome biogenesis protein CcsB, partial [Prochlorococcus sp. AH-716-I19]|nr:c-type cytochrome biogenesis protein CcsB [Prochlorococcus sp. AH-716-I19]
SSIGILIFYFLLINLPISLIALFNKKSSYYVRLITVLINLFISLQLISRWIESGHFPISNLYESLYFLVWGISLGQLLVEKEYPTPIIPAIAIPIELLTIAFACFVLPEDLKLSSNLVPALRSSWLVMHVTVVMLSYAALIIGSLLSASVLFINKSQPLQLRSSSTGVGGFKISNSYSTNNVIESIKFSHSEELDTLSYRSILVGFVLLTLGLITGAIWANEAWGTWWSWDPKETWAFISWLFYAAYLHMRISKGWQGRRPALLATSGFFVVLICYIGVNFLGVGLHSYGWIFGIFNLFKFQLLRL